MSAGASTEDTGEAAGDRAALRAHLIASRIAGRVATTRGNNLANFGKCARREADYTFGLAYGTEWTPARILSLMAEKVGVSPDLGFIAGVDTIDPDLTIDALARMAARLRQAADGRERVLLATGHPDGVYAIHAAVATALADRGATVLTPAAGYPDNSEAGRPRRITYLGGVAVVASDGGPDHTHAAQPMHTMLSALAQAGEPPPDLVIADHGFAGAAGQAGVASVGFADCNDPALFVGEALGAVAVAVPLDDNVAPHLYAPLTSYLLTRAGLRRPGDGTLAVAVNLGLPPGPGRTGQ
jgi:Phosphatase